MQVWLKRAYEEPQPQDGKRILVDRLWPRGVSKEDAAIDEWMTSIAPSTELREWYGHDPDRWNEFRQRYFKELDAAPEAVEELLGHVREGRVTLVFGAKDVEHSHARALKKYLELQTGETL
ncbi:MAG: DUF488 domain-containing protein [Gammaproteobacteria bacterium]|nr:DUF488 domain-containing protein [Gammaproteobacteria bacterium]